MNPTQLQDQDVRTNRKLVEETPDEKPHVINFDSFFLAITPKA